MLTFKLTGKKQLIFFSFIIFQVQFINFYVILSKFLYNVICSMMKLKQTFLHSTDFFSHSSVLTWILSKEGRYTYTWHGNKYSPITQKYIVNTFPCMHKCCLFSSMLTLHTPLWEGCPQQPAVYSVCDNPQPICTVPADQGKGSQSFTSPWPAMSQSSAGQETGQPSLSLVFSFQVLLWFEKP